jgi:hypothetical protein
MLVSDLYEPMRLSLGDELIAGSWGYEDAMVASYIRQPFLLGIAPPYVALATTTDPNDTITPDPNPIETGLILLQATSLFFGSQKAVTWRTRAASFSEAPRSIEIILRQLSLKIQELEEAGGIRNTSGNLTGTPLFGASLDLSTWTTDLASILYGYKTIA